MRSAFSKDTSNNGPVKRTFRRFRSVSIYFSLQIHAFETQLLPVIKLHTLYIQFLFSIEDFQETFGGWSGMSHHIGLIADHQADRTGAPCGLCRCQEKVYVSSYDRKLNAKFPAPLSVFTNRQDWE
jgi:hypothetical protein